MATKLGKKQYPSGHGPDDFECFGPPASKDGAFDGTKIADMGCFKQDGSDTNKYYHAAVVNSKKTGGWFAYYEWGRTGGSKDFMFVQCNGETEAQSTYEKQCHSKNDKRGEWATIAGINTLRAKKGKDCYLVRPMATRSTGLPDAAHIQSEEGATAAKTATKKTAKKKTAKKVKSTLDPQTTSLMRDLNVAVVKYTRGQMADESIPTQVAIDEGRDILAEALKVVAKSRKRIGADASDDEHLAAQVRSKSLIELTNVMYSRIPKIKRRRNVDRGRGKASEAAKQRAREEDKKTFVLTQDNIMLWQADLDAFEAAKLSTTNVEAKETNPLDGMGVEMHWVNINSSEWAWLKTFCARSTRDRHGYLGDMKIKNVWAVRKPVLETGYLACQKRIGAKRPLTNEKPMFSPKSRPDLNGSDKDHKASRTALLFHGTRSVNVSGILTKSLLMPRKLVGVQITGAMFGPGLYFADDWKKSAGYCSLKNSYWAGGASDAVKGRSAFMFLVDTVLGKPHVASGPSGYTKPPHGTHSVFGKAGRSHVQNNEWIVYDSNQHALKYLVEFDA